MGRGTDVAKGGWNQDKGGKRNSDNEMICVKLLAPAVVLTVVVGWLPLTRAATFTVNSTADATDALPGDGVCDNGTGSCTLRAAIREANALAGADTITLPAGTYTLSIAGVDDAARVGDLDITSDLTLRGDGAGTTTIDADNIDRVFDVRPGAEAVITDVTITGGNLPGVTDGGGIRNQGTLILANATVRNNFAGDDGGGLYNLDTLLVFDSAIRDNSVAHYGGGIYNRSGTVTVTSCTISGNSAPDGPNGWGGGIYNEGPTTTVFNSTISGNSAGTGGGGFVNETTLTVTNSTVSDNSAGTVGGGIWNSDTVNLAHTILAGNSAPSGDDCHQQGTGILISWGHNLLGEETGCTSRGIGDLTVDPADVFTTVLGPLLDNGGPTFTHKLLDGSRAVDRIPAALCPVETDQRGVARPQGATCDIGAYELESVCTVRLEADYTDGMMNLSFVLGTSVPAVWNVWIIIGQTVLAGEAIPIPAIDPPLVFPFSFPFPAGFGTVILVTTLSTAEEEILCFDFALVNTG